MGVAQEVAGQLPETSLADQLFAGSLMMLGALVLITRRKSVKKLLKATWPIVLYYSFCLLSLAWSDFAAWGFKRWVRGLGDLIMVLIVVTDEQPITALKRLLSRVGLVLLPASVLLIKYYPMMSSSWDPWGTERLYTGVSTNKNMLGNLVFVLSLGAIWQILTLRKERKSSTRTHRLWAQFILLGFGIKLLYTAHSATSIACFILGSGLMLATYLPPMKRSPMAVHVMVLAIVLGGCFIELLGARAAVAETLGRNADLSGRTAIWKVLTPMVNGFGGAGFETFWVGPRVALVKARVGGWGLTNEAHNGYLEVYLNLGWIGLALIALILGQGYRAIASAFRRDSALAALLMAYVVTALAYNISEAGFRILSVEWFFLLLSVVMANRVAILADTSRRSSFNESSELVTRAVEVAPRLTGATPRSPRPTATVRSRRPYWT
jgi:O-antigen ligase